MGDRKILFSTACRTGRTPDLWRDNAPRDLGVAMTSPRQIHPGLRFIKQNVPEIEILEYPARAEFAEVIQQGWDVAGFSFYTSETNEVLRMAEYARKAGVSELWAGNYGALNPAIASVFDKVFTGYSEAQLARELGREPGDLIHPPLIESVGLSPFGQRFLRCGLLYTARGCPLRCPWCHVVTFAPRLVKLPIDSVERALHFYKRNGVQLVLVYDEIFGLGPGRSHDVVSLLGSYGLPWWIVTRGDVLLRDFEEWYANGLVGANIGLEEIEGGNPSDPKKAVRVESALAALETLNRHGCCSLGAYMFGFEEDTEETVMEAFRVLDGVHPDFMLLYILTPAPMTPLWDHVQNRFGLTTPDWSRFDGKHLVWNHPHLTAETAQELLDYGYELFNSQEYVARLNHKIARNLLTRQGVAETLNFAAASLRNTLHGEEARPEFF
jgi:radical SAM superfamily enzyme YgiQ (UPF0313 family)